MRQPRDWNALEQAHRAAVDEFLAAASAVPAESWAVSPAPGKWSPGQVVLHVAKSYEIGAVELSGGRGLSPRAAWWLRILLRGFYLPRILSTGRLPEGARAPREIRPDGETPRRDEALRRLADAAHRFEEAMRAAGGKARVTHHFFGALRGVAIFQFLAVHTRHHQPQLATPAPGGRGEA